MIKQFEEFRYNFEEQEKKYLKISKKFSEEQKYQLLEQILEKDLWSYFQLITKILFDLASNKKVYLKKLEEIYHRIKEDMASSPFFEMLIKIGKEKRETGIEIYNLIQKRNKDKEFKIISGLILGGYSIQDDSLLKKMIKREISYPLTNIFLKAILVKYEKEKEIDLEVYSYFEEAEKNGNEFILEELMNIYLTLYPINKDYFYKKIKKLINKKRNNLNRMIFIRIKKLGLAKEQFFELIELSKDYDNYSLSNLIYSLIDYPEECKKISELFIYWINKDLEFKIKDLDWVLGELTKKNKKFIAYFLDNYKRIKTKKLPYTYLFPRIFEKLASQNVEEAMKQLMAKKIFTKDSRLFYRLVGKIIGIIYKIDNKKNTFDLFLPLAKKIQDISEKRHFIDENKKRFSNAIKNKNFKDMIDYIDNLIWQLGIRKESYDFKEVKDSLENFKDLNIVIKNKMDILEGKKKYTPLIWLGEKSLDNKLKEAYLEELNKGLAKGKKEVKHFLNSLNKEEQFWERASEIFFANKFLGNSKYFPKLEVLIPPRNSRMDLKIKMNNRDIYFEIKRLGINRNLHLDNSAVIVKNKAKSILKKIHSQHFSEELFKKIKTQKNKTMIFAVLDLSSSSTDEYQIADALYGSSAFQWFINKKNKQTTPAKFVRNRDSLGDENKNTSILSGVIYFKTEPKLEKNKSGLKLKGDIIVNPHAINKPTEKEIKELKKIIFES